MCGEADIPCLNLLTDMLAHRGEQLSGGEDVQLVVTFAPECLITEDIEAGGGGKKKNTMGHTIHTSHSNMYSAW